jgi:divalent metal cation (Fe/Co/Zn/Cd) transporter
MSTTDTESVSTLLVGFAINATIAAAKTTLGVLTGSASMLAEAAHSAVDMLSEVFLLTGARHGRTWSKGTYFWGLLACVNLFLSGAVWAAYEGIRSLITPQLADSLGWVSLAVLAGSALMESVSWRTAYATLNTQRGDTPWSTYLRTCPNVAVLTLFFEDTADIIGCVLAAVGVTLGLLTGTGAWDGIASLLIAALLTGMAYVLGSRNAKLLTA